MKYTVETLLKLKNSPLSVKPDSLTDTWVKPKRKKKNVPEWMDFDPSQQQDDMEMFSKQTQQIDNEMQKRKESTQDPIFDKADLFGTAPLFAQQQKTDLFTQKSYQHSDLFGQQQYQNTELFAQKPSDTKTAPLVDHGAVGELFGEVDEDKAGMNRIMNILQSSFRAQVFSVSFRT